MTLSGSLVSLEIRSDFDMLDVVQVLSDQVGHMAGLDEEATHWVGVAVRESVINAIKHGNLEDREKRVWIEFELAPAAGPVELVIRVRDQGQGFDPGAIADPLAPENVLKASGRGMFFMRSFMDDVTAGPARGGGTVVRMVKRLAPPNGVATGRP